MKENIVVSLQRGLHGGRGSRGALGVQKSRNNKVLEQLVVYITLRGPFTVQMQRKYFFLNFLFFA